MKKVGIFLLLMVVLSGCSEESSELERAMILRSKILKSEQILFSADISADYGDSISLFSMDCGSDKEGNLSFSVTAPDTIADISGTISQGEGKLTFDDWAVCFPLLTDEQLNPVSAPWILMKTLRSGYLRSAGMDEGNLRLTINDSYDNEALQLDIWLDGDDLPRRAEICYDGRTILTLSVRDFRIL